MDVNGVVEACGGHSTPVLVDHARKGSFHKQKHSKTNGCGSPSRRSLCMCQRLLCMWVAKFCQCMCERGWLGGSTREIEAGFR